MKVIFAREYGFCMGVKRAVSLVENLLKEYPDSDISTIGPLIHNSYFLDKLTNQGVKQLADDEVPPHGGIAVIRTHGIAPQKMLSYKKQGVIIEDATCPKVRSSQLWIQKNSLNRTLIVAGDLNHGEVISLCGYCNDSFVVEDAKAAQKLLDDNKISKALLIAQTTFSKSEYQKIIEVLQQGIEDILIRNSICDATTKRQQALKELLSQVEAIVVIGGKSSANTLRLVEIAKAANMPTFHIETLNDINATNLVASKIKTIGVTAGASTPPELIQEIVQKLMQL